jgi:hypothetical protein
MVGAALVVIADSGAVNNVLGYRWHSDSGRAA